MELIVFSFTMSHGYFVTTILSDIYVDDECGAMKELAEHCNGDNVDFYLDDDRKEINPNEYTNLTVMIKDVESTLSQDEVNCTINFITRYITPNECQEEQKDD